MAAGSTACFDLLDLHWIEWRSFCLPWKIKDWGAVCGAQSLILRHLFLFYSKFWQFLSCFCAPPLNIPFHLCLHSLPKIPSVFRTWRSCVLRTSRHELVGRPPSDCSRYCPYLCKKRLIILFSMCTYNHLVCCQYGKQLQRNYEMSKAAPQKVEGSKLADGKVSSSHMMHRVWASLDRPLMFMLFFYLCGQSKSEASLVAMDFSGKAGGRVIQNLMEAQSAEREEGLAWRVRMEGGADAGPDPHF